MMNSYMYVIFFLLAFSQSAVGCYTSLFAFGDSLTDTGNLVVLKAPKIIHQARLPNGETYFQHPTGRCCDGRLIVDLLAQSFGLPIAPPYLKIKSSTNSTTIGGGVNFAVSGARALETAFYEKLGIYDSSTNVTLGVQLDWFKDLLPSFCEGKADCRGKLKRSICVLGFGGDDYFYASYDGKSREERARLVPLVTDAVASAVKELIELGVGTVVVPGLVPEGCLAAYIEIFGSSFQEDYDPFTGCLIWMNKFAEHHNGVLQKKLKHVQEIHPTANVIYADYYNHIMQLYLNPEKYGFTKSKAACCGGGGLFNFNLSAVCGDPLTKACPDPSTFINWDGYHFSEAANMRITSDLLRGPFATILDHSCILQQSTTPGLSSIQLSQTGC